MKYIVFLLSFIFVPHIFAAEVHECLPPTKLEELDANLEQKLTLINLPGGLRQTEQYENLTSQKYHSILAIVEAKFPQNYKDIFYHYAENFKTLDRIYAKILDDQDPNLDNGTVQEIYSDWLYNHYIFSEIFPTILKDREMIRLRILSPPKNVAIETEEFLSAMPYEELSERNLKICREQESDQIGKDRLDKLKAEQADLPYRWNIVNPDTKTYSGVFDTDYESLSTLAELGGNRKFISDPHSKTIEKESEESFAIWQWMKNAFDYLDFRNDRKLDTNEKTIAENVAEGEINQNLNYILNRDRNLQVKSRYTDWRSHRNYWVHKTKDVGGYNTDVMVEKFEIMLDAILRTNAELERSLRAIEYICQNQNVPIHCWDGGNNLPGHATTIPELYEDRSATERD